ncbi:MAG: bifunctional glutamate N-acetyltransferase/amino-acid acetyltransferase ArgJ [Anaerolineae bacterium]
MPFWVGKRIKDASITNALGFKAAGVACGLKPQDALDLAVVASEVPCVAAGVFTTNAFQAAPVLYDRTMISSSMPAQAVVINSGCANACTGDQGMADVVTTAETTAELLSLAPESVLVMSTGVIGKPMPMDKIVAGLQAAVPVLAASTENGHAAARAIMTTDTRPKEVALRVAGPTGGFTIAGMAKGAGMIQPNMATMLCLVVTDAALKQEVLQLALHAAVENTFNCITVDGDMSTNDTVLVLANGAAGIPAIDSTEHPAYEAFYSALETVMSELAQAVVRDGEGATRFVTIRVQHAINQAQARKVAKSVANSLLVKTAIYGQDANWGRIVCAIGYSEADIQPEKVGVWLGDLELVRGGAPYNIDEEHSTALLSQKDINITIDLGQGDDQATIWTCDLSHGYVDINAHYRT